MDRRTFVKSSGAAATGLALAGCLGGGNGGGGATDEGDQPVNATDPGWFDVDSNVVEEKMGKEVTVTESTLFRTSGNFGVQFTVANQSGAPLTGVTVHVSLQGQDGKVMDTFEVTLEESTSIDDLAPNEKWQGSIVFENTEADVMAQDLVSYDIWATGRAEAEATPNTTTDGTTTQGGGTTTDGTTTSGTTTGGGTTTSGGGS